MSDTSPNDDQRQSVTDFKSRVTQRISDSTRVVGFGLLAMYFTIMVSDGAAATALRDSYFWWFLWIAAVLGVISIVLDYLQNMYAEQSAALALTRPGYFFDKTSLPYRRQDWCFRAKQWAAVTGAVFALLLMTAQPFVPLRPM